jgi:hypothetical protein
MSTSKNHDHPGILAALIGLSGVLICLSGSVLVGGYLTQSAQHFGRPEPLVSDVWALPGLGLFFVAIIMEAVVSVRHRLRQGRAKGQKYLSLLE